MPTHWKRDLETDGRKFRDWLARTIPGASDVAITPLTSPTSSGFSNETLLCEATWSERGAQRSESLVVRVQPIGYQVFPEYDMGLQFRTMQLLGRTDVPVPRALWLAERDTEVFGAPFYVMACVNGRVPTDQPPYHAGGWMHEISPEERRAIFLGGFEAMAKIHRLDVEKTGFGFLRKPGFANGLEQELAFYRNYFAWAAAGREQPIIERALAWLEANEPSGEPNGLVWGDARIGNILFDGTRVAAVLDWEMVTVGSPEKDLGWAVFLDRHHSEGINTPRLAGFPSYDEAMAHYEALSGHRVKHLHYYQVFAGFRFGVVMMRIAQQLLHYGLMTAEQSRAMEQNNTVTELTAKLLGAPHPQELLRP
ncbi:MAG: phosphotransferase family protein [Deltaproteobacteria bacterium]|nr:phosphotransferase family protein [Deltaproteobacteria bacterium]